MRQAIYKWPLKVTDLQVVSMPRGARILAVQSQDDTVCAWALVDLDAPKEHRRFRIVGTGTGFPDPSPWTYLGTAQTLGGQLVWHVFEEKL